MSRRRHARGIALPEALRRSWRRLLRAVLPARVTFFYSPSYEVGFAGTPIDRKRGERILTFLFSAGLLRHRSLERSHRISLKALRRVHDDGYLDSLHEMSSLVPVVGYEPDDRAGEKALDAQRHAVGGTVAASRRALETRRPAVNLGGGYHHADRDGGRGFCIFNDVAVAINELRRRGFAGPISVIDLDLHDGNGTRRIFAEDESVFTLSLHNRSWDLEPARASRSVELGDDVEDDAYLAAIDEHLPAALSEHRPELVYYLAGTDPAHDDRLGNWEISAEGMLERDVRVLEAIKRQVGRGTPVVILLAGGYGSDTWRYSARLFAWLLSGRRDIRIPTTNEATLSRLREIVRYLEPAKPAASDDDWGLTEADVYGSLGEVGRRTRLLDFFSPHGVELILERSGLFDQLRAQGFGQPTLAFELDNPAGQTLRIFGDADRKELLIEVRVARDRATIEDFDLLLLQWLVSQNPRAEFHPERPALPGQKHPGLGLLRDLMALLVLLAERLQLDGILFVPSHYHLAAKGRRYLRFADPADAAWVRAVDEAVEPLQLGDASRAVRDGRVIDETTGEPLTWRPMSMVIPLSERLHAHLESAAYEKEVREARRSFRFRLVEPAPGGGPPPGSASESSG